MISLIKSLAKALFAPMPRPGAGSTRPIASASCFSSILPVFSLSISLKRASAAARNSSREILPSLSVSARFRRALASALLKRADTDKDGKISRDEFLAAAEALFKEIDKENTGKIDEKQLAEAIGRVLPAPGRGMGANSAFANDLIKDIIPFVESH